MAQLSLMHTGSPQELRMVVHRQRVVLQANKASPRFAPGGYLLRTVRLSPARPAVPSLCPHLGLAVGAQPGAGAVLADLRQAVAQLGGQHVGEGHQLGGLVGGVPEHVALVASADLLQRLSAHAVDTLANIRRLLLDVHQDLNA